MKIKFIKNKNVIKDRGFTLVETLVAIFILLVSTTGPLTFAQSGLRASFQARDQIVAFFLAQDSIEIIKNLRDQQGFAPSGRWLDSLGSCTPDTGTVTCNTQTIRGVLSLTSCGGIACTKMKYDSTSRSFVYDGSYPLSKYTRTIYVTETQRDKEAQVIVEVSWDSNFFGTKRIIAQENIYSTGLNYRPK